MYIYIYIYIILETTGDPHRPGYVARHATSHGGYRSAITRAGLAGDGDELNRDWCACKTL